MVASLFLLILAVSTAVSITAYIYGVYLSFRARWYKGLAALLIPALGMVVGLAAIFYGAHLWKPRAK